MVDTKSSRRQGWTGDVKLRELKPEGRRRWKEVGSYRAAGKWIRGGQSSEINPILASDSELILWVGFCGESALNLTTPW